MPTTEQVLDVIPTIQERADRLREEQVLSTYYDFRAIKTALASTTNGVLLGRRGTGKSHALRYLSLSRAQKGDLVIHIDLATDVGSTGQRYADGTLSLAERATRLVTDIASILHQKLRDELIAGNGIPVPDDLDLLADSLGEVLIIQSVEVEGESTHSFGTTAGGALRADSQGISGGLEAGSTEGSQERSRTLSRSTPAHRIQFGGFTNALQRLLEAHDATRVWLLLDEWTEVPIDLQPYVAEMLRLLFFRAPKVTVRIAAIGHRANWRIPTEDGGYVGLEIGAELFPIFDLDDYAVFPGATRAEQSERSRQYFRSVVFRHINEALRREGLDLLADEDEMVRLVFTQATALHELAMAAEGVPRDAVQILKSAVGHVPEGGRISTEHIRRAAHSIFISTKETHLNGVPFARELVDKIKSDVIGSRKARAFLLTQSDAAHPLIQRLIDDRLLHLVRRSYSSRAAPGTRYDVIEIDYGFYVDLLGTGAAPVGLLRASNEDDDMAQIFAGIEVPDYDYRSIRNAVLDLNAVLAELGAR